MDDTAMRGRWVMVVVLAVAYAISTIDRYVIGLVIDPIAKDLMLSDVEVALVTGFGFSVFYAAFGLYLGRLADRLNRRNLVGGGIAVWSAMTAATGLAQGGFQLLGARIGVAAGEAALTPAAYSLIADRFEAHERPRAGAVFYIGGALGPGLALVVGGALYRIGSQVTAMPAWRFVLLTLAAAGLLWAVVVALLVREPRRANLITHEKGNDAIAVVWSQRSILAPFAIAMALFSMYGNGLMAWAPAYLQRVHGLGVAEAGAKLGTGVTIAAAGALFAGWLAGRLVKNGRADGVLRTILGLTWAAAPVALYSTIADNGTVSLIAICLAVFAMIGASSMAPVLILSLVPANARGQTVAAYALVISIVSVGAGPVAVAAITEHVFAGPNDVGKAASALGLILMPLALALFHTAARRRPQA